MNKNDKDENDKQIQPFYINKYIVIVVLFFVWYLFIEQVPGNNRIITSQVGNTSQVGGTRMDIGTICAIVFAFLVCSGSIIR
jgi:hypothetical protein